MNISNTRYLIILLGLFSLSNTTGASSKSWQLSEYTRLAYKPSEETRVIDMPSSLFAVQLLAVSTKQQVEDFAQRHNLYDLTAVRIEQKGKSLYVLIPGVYKSREDAEAAVASLPKEIQAMKPWIRPLDGLQEAMRRVQRTTYAVSDD